MQLHKLVLFPIRQIYDYNRQCMRKQFCALCFGKELILHNCYLHNQWAQKELSTIDSTVTDKTTTSLLYQNEGARQNQKFQTPFFSRHFSCNFKIG